MKKLLFSLILFIVFVITGCSSHSEGTQWFFVQSSSFGYYVSIYDRGAANAVQISKYFPNIYEATALANHLNSDMQNNWINNTQHY